jgi:hypothetical protein
MLRSGAPIPHDDGSRPQAPQRPTGEDQTPGNELAALLWLIATLLAGPEFPHSTPLLVRRGGGALQPRVAFCWKCDRDLARRGPSQRLRRSADSRIGAERRPRVLKRAVSQLAVLSKTV